MEQLEDLGADYMLSAGAIGAVEFRMQLLITVAYTEYDTMLPAGFEICSLCCAIATVLGAFNQYRLLNPNQL